jgi:hypothetical protein
VTFEDVVRAFESEPDVALGKGFHNAVLKRAGKIFAMDYDDTLVVKLPAGRCAELIETTSAIAFDRGQGKPLREWVVIADQESWLALAREALAFARAGRTTAH